MAKYLVGSLPEAERAASASLASSKSRGSSGTGGSDSSSPLTWIMYAIPAVVVALAVLYQFGLIGQAQKGGK
jgi:hypothetical protein